jgi:hypothetical protein
MGIARFLHTATLLNSGKVLIDGTCTDSGVDPPELYDPVTGTFSGVLGTDPFALNPCGSAVLLPDRRVFTTRGPGPYDVAVAGLYDPSTGEFSRTILRKTAGVYGTPATLLTDGTVLIGGGYDECTACRFGNAELFEPASGTFTLTGSMNHPRAEFTATLLRDGKVLMAGGDLSPASAELYDPIARTFTPTENLTVPRLYHTGTLLMDGRILIAGGIADSRLSPPTDSAELYLPSVRVPAQTVTDMRFDRTIVVAGSAYRVDVSGSNLNSQTYIDVRFISPGNSVSNIVLNWQRGLSASHIVPAGTASGNWRISGVRAHEIETDHTGSFFPVSAAITVSP